MKEIYEQKISEMQSKIHDQEKTIASLCESYEKANAKEENKVEDINMCKREKKKKQKKIKEQMEEAK
eukprot:CAMPEP_0202960616 /NCGR_PEP_ID=MMETSP1396-20130829/4767_1 /ASSEMBLY_ACC=CAM_ASM_000872 /TAXON_ID= /ORGANISM="Pseudokeronopsis sp., Strain Brazil" /LENGTH=66 /DNA_ID=CAMNT_0049679951 /DNA_START=592 /DNA_END=792 /DNA_ORIENTATION=-